MKKLVRQILELTLFNPNYQTKTNGGKFIMTAKKTPGLNAPGIKKDAPKRTHTVLAFEIVVQDDMPIEKPISKKTRYPFANMQVGQSFDYPQKAHLSVSTAARNFRKKSKIDVGFEFGIVNDEMMRVKRIK